MDTQDKKISSFEIKFLIFAKILSIALIIIGSCIFKETSTYILWFGIIIVAGFVRKNESIYMAFYLGVFHFIRDYFSNKHISLDTVLIAGMFICVALLFNSLIKTKKVEQKEIATTRKSGVITCKFGGGSFYFWFCIKIFECFNGLGLNLIATIIPKEEIQVLYFAFPQSEQFWQVYFLS